MDELTRLARAAQGGDRAALAAFVERSQGDVWRFCAHLNGVAHADDLAQDTFARAIGSMPRYRADVDAKTWLLSIARRACADQVRSAVRRRGLLDRIASRRAADQAVSPSDHAADIWELVASLDRDRREAFVLTQVLGLSYNEAAAVCGCPVGTIRSRVARARGELIAQLTVDQPGTASSSA